MGIELKPFIKWAGGKRQLLPAITQNLPAGMEQFDTYVEPFLGGGTVLLHMLNHYNFTNIHVGDLNPALVNVYETIKTKPTQLTQGLTRLQDEYSTQPGLEAKKTFYLKNRDLYNTLMKTTPTHPQLAALFIFLNKTGFNGLYRVNRKGEYNVPFGKHHNPHFYDPKNIANLHEAFQKVVFHTGSYETLNKHITPTSFVYLDPPYRPLTNTASFTTYTNSQFNDTHQEKLAHNIHAHYQAGTHLLLSNSDPHNVNPNDNFFDDLYEWADIVRVPANRNINSKGTARNKITEILVKCYPPTFKEEK